MSKAISRGWRNPSQGGFVWVWVGGHCSCCPCVCVCGGAQKWADQGRERLEQEEGPGLHWCWSGAGRDRRHRGLLVEWHVLRPGPHLEAEVRTQPAEWPLLDGFPDFLIRRGSRASVCPSLRLGARALTLEKPRKVVVSSYAD